MGSPVSLKVAILYMEHFERTALRTVTTSPRLRLIYVITPLSSNMKNTNITFWNIPTM